MYVDKLSSELLLDKEATLSITRALVSTVYPDRHLAFASNKEREEYKRISFTIDRLWENNADVIFNYAALPLEKRFFNTFNLYCLEARFSLVMFMPPSETINKEVAGYIHNFKNSMKMWKYFQEESHVGEPMVFLNHLQRIGIDKKNLMIIQRHVLLESLIFDYFHFSIKSTFDEFQFQNKPIHTDIYIWMPAKPDFKMLVELDEFHDHSDKQSFTADRARDRFLKSRGFQVLRFSADELNDDCVAKAKELRDYLLSIYHEQLFVGSEEASIFRNIE